jgi:general secretion pathway protein G
MKLQGGTMSGKRSNRGFTLIELLVVLAILGLMAGIIGPQVIQYLGESKTKTAKLQIDEFGSALDLFHLDVGRYPSNDEGLEALVQSPAAAGKWHGPYLKKNFVPTDPWGNSFHYRFPGEHGTYDIYSYGADNRAGGDDENQDIGSWQ